MTNRNLWLSISQFNLDDPESEFKFSDRLKRENGWTEAYCQRVIREYFKFLYLCYISERHITPSDPVDQVWHLHLTYTQSYWMDLCHKTLGKQIHHGPTKGGRSEGEKFHQWYDLTFECYRREFKEEPPADVWWPSHKRFKEIHFTRVNRHRYWVIRKPDVFLIRSLVLLLCAVVVIALFSFAINGYGLALVLLIVILIIANIRNNRGKRKGRRRRKNGRFWNSSGCSSVGCGTSGCGSSGCGGCGN